MASKKIFLVFVLPVIFSVLFGAGVMADILEKPDRELNMWQISYSEESSSHNAPIEIVGLSSQYSTSSPVEIQVKISDSSFDCGDLYVTIYSSGKEVVTQGGFLKQCFEPGNKLLPIDDEFSYVVDSSGSYEITAQMVSKDLENISTTEKFTIK